MTRHIQIGMVHAVRRMTERHRKLKVLLSDIERDECGNGHALIEAMKELDALNDQACLSKNDSS